MPITFEEIQEVIERARFWEREQGKRQHWNRMLVCTNHFNGLGQLEQRTYSLSEGSGPIEIDYRFFDELGIYPRIGLVFSLPPLRLRVVRVNLSNMMYPVFLCEFDGPRAWLLQYTSALTLLADKIYRRLILTAAVWGLARVDEATVPSWRDLNIVRRRRKRR